MNSYKRFLNSINFSKIPMSTYCNPWLNLENSCCQYSNENKVIDIGSNNNFSRVMGLPYFVTSYFYKKESCQELPYLKLIHILS